MKHRIRRTLSRLRDRVRDLPKQHFLDREGGTTLAGWLLEHIIDEEIEAKANLKDRRPSRQKRLIAECVAKRRIINEHVTGLDGRCGRCGVAAPCPTVRLLSLPYAGKPGYRLDWYPDRTLLGPM